MSRTKVPSHKPRPVKKRNLRLRRSKTAPAKIVIDEAQGLVFSSEKDLFAHFNKQIEALDAEYLAAKPAEDIDEATVPNLEDELDHTLDEPAEIWHDAVTFKEFPIFHFIRPLESVSAYHVAVAYVSSEDEPTFIFLHFVTRSLTLVEHFRRGDLVYDRAFEEIGFGAIDGDALSEGDPLAMGLFISMLKVRADKDVPYEKFQELGNGLREDTIENADEIWRNIDLNGNQLVTFIKEAPDHDIKDLYYVVVTQQDPTTNVHSLLFSFPTTDSSLVDRYRHGENLQADEVVQESSH